MPPRGAQEATGIAEIVRAVRDQVGHGADWVKLYADYRRGPSLMAERGVALFPTLAAEEAYSEYFEGHVRGTSEPTADMEQ